MGFQIFPEPVSSAGEDTTNYGFFNRTNATGKRLPNESSISGINIWYSTASAPAGFYRSETTDTFTSGWALFNDVQLTPSNTATVTIRVATSSNNIKMAVRQSWQSLGLTALGNIATTQVKFFNVYNTTTSPVFLAGLWDYRGITPYVNPIAISTNGVSWTRSYITGWTSNDNIQGRASFYKNGESFVITNSNIHASTDLVNWSTKATISVGSPADAIYDEITNRFYIVSQSLEPTYRTSTDAVNWSTGTWGAVTNGTRFFIKRVNDFLYAYGSGNNNWNHIPTIQVSTNGIDWQIANFTTSLNQWSTALTPTVYDIEYGNGFYWAVVGSGYGVGTQRDTILMSTNGFNFNVTYGPTTGIGFASAMWDPVNQMAMTFGFMTTTASILTSTNGINWTNVGLPNAISNSNNPAGFPDGNAQGYANYARYVPAAPDKYFLALHPDRAGNNAVTALTTGRIRYSNNIGGSSSGSFQMIVNRYNLTVDNTE